jgi:hypothetical protein
MATRKQQAANGGPGSVELIDGIGILHAHGLVDLDGLMVLRALEVWLRRVRRARGLPDASPGGLWEAITSGQGATRKWTVPITDPNRRTAGDRAWRYLVRIRNAFAEVHQLETLALVMSVAAGDHRPSDHVELVALHHGVDMVRGLIRRGRRLSRCNIPIATILSISGG